MSAKPINPLNHIHGPFRSSRSLRTRGVKEIGGLFSTRIRTRAF